MVVLRYVQGGDSEYRSCKERRRNTGGLEIVVNKRDVVKVLVQIVAEPKDSCQLPCMPCLRTFILRRGGRGSVHCKELLCVRFGQ